MEELKKEKSENKKVFFITSNPKKLEVQLNYEIQNYKGITNLKIGSSNAEIKETIESKEEKFNVYINSIEIVPKDLKEEDKDQISKKYKAQIFLKYDNYLFPGFITFNPNQNNFLYDFEFKEYYDIGNFNTKVPPPQLNLTKFEQLNLYITYLNDVLKKKLNDQIYKDLINESKIMIYGKKITLDFYLEIFRKCYNDKDIKLLLESFKLGNIILPKNFKYENYSKNLNMIEKRPNNITKHYSKEEDKNNIIINFYTLILFVRANYDREKANELVNNKESWKYLIHFLPHKANFFRNIKLNDGLIQEMFTIKLNSKLVFNILSFCNSIEQLLILINDKIDIISKIYLNEKSLLLLSSLAIPQKNDNLDKIFLEIEKIINNEYYSGKVFISFDEEFWRNYIHSTDDVKKLFLLNRAIILCSTVEKNLKEIDFNIINKIHKNGLESIRNGKIKNEELIDFIKKDLYFSDDKYKNEQYRPFDIVIALDFDTMTEDFFLSWYNLDIFKIYSFGEDEFKNLIFNQVKDMKHFGKLLKLFYIKNKNKSVFDSILAHELAVKLKNLLKNYKIENCPSIIEDISYFIYIIDFHKLEYINKNVLNIIETYIHSDEIKIEIFTYLLKSYKDLSKELIEIAIDYLAKNKDKINHNNFLSLLEKVNSKITINSLLSKTQIFSIKENDLFNQKKDMENFLLLESIHDKVPLKDLKETNYFMNEFNNKEKILKKIMTCEINYNILKSIYTSPEKKN